MCAMSLADFDPDGAAEGDGLYGLPFTPEESRVVVLPVPWEATVSYRKGTARGPEAIREASRQVDLHDPDTGDPWKVGIALLPEDAAMRRAGTRARRLVERGKNRAEVNRLCAAAHESVYRTSRDWLSRGKFVALLGGDHSTPFGLIRAVAERHPGVGVLQLDAHADLRVAYEGYTWSHASILTNVLARIPRVSRLVQIGLRDLGRGEIDVIRSSPGRITSLLYADYARARLAGQTFAKILFPYVSKLPRKVHLTFDIDGLDPSLCPNTGTPVPGGFSFAEACELLRLVVASGRTIVGLDLNEVAPPKNGSDEWDANVGARLLYKMIGYSLLSERRSARAARSSSRQSPRRRSPRA